MQQDSATLGQVGQILSLHNSYGEHAQLLIGNVLVLRLIKLGDQCSKYQGTLQLR